MCWVIYQSTEKKRCNVTAHAHILFNKAGDKTSIVERGGGGRNSRERLGLF